MKSKDVVVFNKTLATIQGVAAVVKVNSFRKTDLFQVLFWNSLSSSYTYSG
jgi:hypothetical protein